MRVKVSKNKDGLHYQGVFYAKDEDGYCEIAQDVALRAGYVRADQIDTEAEAETGKEALIERAHSLGIAAPSVLKRWSAERIEREIVEVAE